MESWLSASRRAQVEHANERDKHPTSDDNTRGNHAIHSRDCPNVHHKMLNSARVYVKEKWRTLPHSAFIRPPACPT
jgi:hypothetical protein